MSRLGLFPEIEDFTDIPARLKAAWNAFNDPPAPVDKAAEAARVRAKAQNIMVEVESYGLTEANLMDLIGTADGRKMACDFVAKNPEHLDVVNAIQMDGNFASYAESNEAGRRRDFLWEALTAIDERVRKGTEPLTSDQMLKYVNILEHYKPLGPSFVGSCLEVQRYKNTAYGRDREEGVAPMRDKLFDLMYELE